MWANRFLWYILILLKPSIDCYNSKSFEYLVIWIYLISAHAWHIHSATHWYEQKFVSVYVCKVTPKHLSQTIRGHRQIFGTLPYLLASGRMFAQKCPQNIASLCHVSKKSLTTNKTCKKFQSSVLQDSSKPW